MKYLGIITRGHSLASSGLVVGAGQRLRQDLSWTRRTRRTRNWLILILNHHRHVASLYQVTSWVLLVLARLAHRGHDGRPRHGAHLAVVVLASVVQRGHG